MKIKILDQTHEDYNERFLHDCHLLYAGGPEWAGCLNRWIPQNPQETEESYTYRAGRATYENNVGPIVNLVSGSLFTIPPVVEEASAWLSEWVRDVDQAGTGLSPWFENMLSGAMVFGRAYAWVNLPRAGQEFGSLAEQEQAGALDPFLVHLTGYGVRNWRHDGRGRLLWLVHRGTDTIQESALDQARKRIRWTIIDTVSVSTFEWTAPEDRPLADPRPDEDATLVDVLEHGAGRVPVVELDLCKVGLHTMRVLRDPAIALVRSQNDLDYGLHRAAHPILWVLSKWQNERPLVGAGTYFRLRRDDKGEDQMGFASPDAASLSLLSVRVTAQREGLYRVVNQMAQSADGNATRAQVSGESKNADWRATEIIMTQLAGQIRPAISATIRLATELRGSEEAVNVTGLEGWHSETMMDWLLAAAQASTVVRYSESAIRLMAKTEARKLFIHASEAEMQQIEREIEQAEIRIEEFMPPEPPEPGGGGEDGRPEYAREDESGKRRG